MTLPIKHVLPDGAGVVVDVLCPFCQQPVAAPRRCEACQREVCGAGCYAAHLVATDNEADAEYAASARAPDAPALTPYEQMLRDEPPTAPLVLVPN